MVDEELLIKTSVKLYLKTIFPSNLQYTCLTVSDVSLSLIQYCWNANFQWRYAANFYRIEDYPSGTMPDKHEIKVDALWSLFSLKKIIFSLQLNQCSLRRRSFLSSFIYPHLISNEWYSYITVVHSPLTCLLRKNWMAY